MRQVGALSIEAVDCGECQLGRAAGVGNGAFCPFIIREHPRDQVLCRAGDPAARIWFVKRGLVGLTTRTGDDVEIDALRLAGGYVGLECLVGDVYTYSARTLARTTLCEAPRDGFLRWLRGDEERLVAILRAVFGDLVAAAQPGLAWPTAP
jgi:CRP-like cAMP-binding protein